MKIDGGYLAHESDIDRACSVFGLDTVNYRAFPDNGPVPAPIPEPPAGTPLVQALAGQVTVGEVVLERAAAEAFGVAFAAACSAAFGNGLVAASEDALS
jgi:hypothetical protein